MATTDAAPLDLPKIDLADIPGRMANTPGNIFVCLVTPNGYPLVYFSPGAPMTMGYQDDEYRDLAQDNALSFIFEGDVERAMHDAEKTLMPTGHLDGYYRYRHKSAGVVWIHVSAQVMGTSEGRPVVVFNFEGALAGSDLGASVFDYAPTMVLICAYTTHEVLYMNQVACDHYHVTRAEAYGQPCHQVLRGTTEVCPWCPANDHVRDKTRLKTYQDYYGSWIRIHGRRITWSGFDAYVHFIEDVTQEHREQELYHSTMQALLEANPRSLCTFLLNLTSNTVEERHGSSPYVLQKVQGDSADQIISSISDLAATEHDRQKLLETLDREHLISLYDQGETGASVEYRRIGERDEVQWVDSFIKMVRNPVTGHVEGVIYSVDVTDRMRERAILATLAAKEHDFVGLLHLKTKDIEPLRFTNSLVDRSYERLNIDSSERYPYETGMRFTADNWFDGEEREKYLARAQIDAILRDLDRDGICEFTVQGHDMDDHSKIFCRKFEHYYLGNDTDTVLLVQSDVTESYRQQIETVEREKELRLAADAASRAKSDFLSRMSHDIRTPINGITGMAAIARKDPDNAEHVLACLDKIEASSHHLLSLINNVLDMNKLERGEVELEEVRFSLGGLLEDCVALISTQATETGLSITCDFDDIRHGDLVGSERHVRQVLVNLLSNAVKYTKRGGSIRFSAHETGDDGERASYRFEVDDTGIGMTEEFQRRIFEPFTQETSGARTRYAGSGLGLSIVRDLVRKMGGEIAFESEKGVGTTFTVDLAFGIDAQAGGRGAASDSDGAAAGDAAGDVVASSNSNGTCGSSGAVPSGGDATPPAASLEGLHVLLAEDNALNQEIALYLLKDAGASVDAVGDGQAAVEAFSASAPNAYDVLLMDIMMPRMNGLDATRAIRALDRPDARTVTIIAMTANAFVNDVDDAEAAGMDDYLVKPVNIDRMLELLAAIRR